jgi:NAD(P)-dependent dehydrogenase (short-subunit alcohol dehydrogenase family)
VLPLDVSEASSIVACLRDVASEVSSLSLVINNAGINSERQPQDWVSTASAAEAMDVYRTNVVGPLLITQQTLPLLRAAVCSSSPPPAVINISSTFASLALNDDGNNAVYKLSKVRSVCRTPVCCTPSAALPLPLC